MEARKKIDIIHQILNSTTKRALFGTISPIHMLTHPPVPLTTAEMHTTSGDIIRQAQREVLLEFYKFSANSDGGKEIFDALNDLKTKAEKEKTKINVCMLVNSRNWLAETLYKRNTPTDIEGLTSSKYFTIKLTLHPTSAFGTLHTKLIIIDSYIAMIRSGDPHISSNLSLEQYETATLVRGSIVSTMREDYNTVWKAYCNESLDDITPVETTSSPHAADAVSIPCSFISKQENGNPFYFTDCVSPYKIALLQAISDAQLSIHILTSNVNDTDICTALAKACSRGVRIKILTGKHHNDTHESWWGGTNLSSIAELVRQIEFKFLSNLAIHWATNSRGDIVHHGERFTLHGKYACIDSELVFVGSTPLDVQGVKYSREADIIFEDKATAIQFDSKFFNQIFGLGKNYFEDAYYRIFNQIELQAKRIEDTATTALQTNKYKRLYDALTTIAGEKLPMHEKLFALLNSTLPHLQNPTGTKPGMPKSYNSVYALLVKYGIEHHHLAKKQLSPQKSIVTSNNSLFALAASPVSAQSSQKKHEKENVNLRKSL